jgi:hypothetical protein
MDLSEPSDPSTTEIANFSLPQTVIRFDEGNGRISDILVADPATIRVISDSEINFLPRSGDITINSESGLIFAIAAQSDEACGGSPLLPLSADPASTLRDLPTCPVPEPSSVVLFSSGFVGFATLWVIRRRRPSFN